MTSTGVVTTTGHCASHGYHAIAHGYNGMKRCPKCSTGIPQPLKRRTAYTNDETLALNAIAAALHRIADALEKENP